MVKIFMACLLMVLLTYPTKVTAQTLRVDPPGWTNHGSFNPVDFGGVAVGETASITFNLISEGPTWLAIQNVELLDNDHGYFAITSIVNPIPPELAPGGWIEVELTYEPLELGTHTAILRIVSNDRVLHFLDGPLTGTAVPEPMSLALLALGGLTLIRRH